MGSNDDFEALYRRHAAAVFRFTWGLCGSREQAEDIAAETFARVLTRAPKIETQTALAYLLAVARNIFIDGVRKHGREVPLPEQVLGTEIDMENRLDERSRIAAAIEALEDVPEGERAAFLLRVDHELSYEEIGAALGINVVAAKVRVHRARVRLATASRKKGRTS